MKEMTRLGMLIDLKRCIGCDACTIACKQEQGTPPDVMFARVLTREYGTFPTVKKFFLPILCNHCEEPACVTACPNEAIKKRLDGIVYVDEEKCSGAKCCVSACPYGAIFYPSEGNLFYFGTPTDLEKYHSSKRVKFPVAMKCNFCTKRVDQGLEPACVITCPSGARIFGDIDDPNSKLNMYLRERTPREEPTKLMPNAETKPSVMYLT